ncbi:MAG: nucleotidyltransferase domain-containing protein [Saprospiraceae bacterium]|nr:nucleotidyltransferase domain-containing protein [Saprospiraceae bacterium]
MRIIRVFGGKIAKTIHDNDPLAEAYLFGSRARGDSKPNSDWDILILVNDTKVTNEIYLP